MCFARNQDSSMIGILGSLSLAPRRRVKDTNDKEANDILTILK